MIAPLLLLGLLGLMLAKRSPGAASAAPAKPKTPGDIAQRIVKETQEIIDGKREEYTDDSTAVDAELERARQAVQLAQQKEAQTPASSSSSSSSAPAKMSVGPVQVKKPAQRPPGKPAAKPAAAAPAPAGTDLALAKQTAAKVAAHLKQAGRDKYDHKVLKLWQTRAGVAPDGIYGRGAAAALKYFTPTAPAAFFAQGVASYTPPKA